MVPEVRAGYTRAAPELIPRFEALDPAAIYAPIASLLPTAPARVLDLGAGTGRDAAWLAAQGHEVLAVEPVRPLREAGQALHPEVAWLDDALPDLPQARARGERFDLILLSGVWQHLREPERERAVPVLASLLAPDGRLVISVRHGPGAPDRPCFPADPDALIAAGVTAGLRPVLTRETDSIQAGNRARGVRWTWVGLAASPRTG